jgi:hypothetical protein
MRVFVAGPVALSSMLSVSVVAIPLLLQFMRTPG